VRAFTVLYLSKKTYSKSLNYIACIGYQLALNPTKGTPVSAGIELSRSKPNERIFGPLEGMDFVKIPGGNFMMGSNDGESDEKPVHKVTVEPFYMMTTEVTQAMWKEITGKNFSHFKGDSLPVESVSWDDCQEFIKKLNRRDPGNNYRLPSESEWEYACRAGTTTKYHSGDSKSDLGRVGWYRDNSGRKTHPVEQKKPNAWSLYDMHGNVWEWCEDKWHSNYNGAPREGSAWISGNSSLRVLRGGSWGNNPDHCRSADRDWREPDYCIFYGGFRLARSL